MSRFSSVDFKKARRFVHGFSFVRSSYSSLKNSLVAGPGVLSFDSSQETVWYFALAQFLLLSFCTSRGEKLNVKVNSFHVDTVGISTVDVF